MGQDFDAHPAVTPAPMESTAELAVPSNNVWGQTDDFPPGEICHTNRETVRLVASVTEPLRRIMNLSFEGYSMS
jgi:hypothetical protein